MNDELRVYLILIIAMLAYANGWLGLSVIWAICAGVFAFIDVIKERKKKANAKKAQH